MSIRIPSRFVRFGAVAALVLALGACTTAQKSDTRVAGKREARRGLASTVEYKVLTVAKQGSGMGIVTSRPEGLECGSTCALDVKNSRQVRVFAQPDTGSTFGGWSLPECGTNPECKIKMSSDLTLVATFNGVACPAETPHLCDDGSCAMNADGCNAACPPDLPYFCPNGSCAPDSASCPQ